METSTLTYIVKRAQKGDIDARQTLYLDSAKSVYYLALKILKNPEDAEDITQDVFIVVYDKLADLKEPAAYYKWLNQITANKCMSFLRKKKPQLGDEQDLLEILEPEEDDISLMPDKAYDNAETRRIIMEIIDRLPDAQRVVIMYRYFSQLSIDEIAEMTATNVHTVKSRLALARQKIREAILEKEEKDGIRLHVLIPFTPILQKALEEFTMPEGVSEAMWQNIAQAISAPTAANGGSSSSSTGAESGATTKAAGATTTAGTTGAVAGGTAAGMALITKIIIGVAAVAVIAAGAVFLPRIINPDDTNTPSGQSDQIDTSLGVYDGDLVDGVRSGYGSWAYGNYYYEGYWENDMPNGEGALYIAHAIPEEHGIQWAIIGNYVNGYANGLMTYIHYSHKGYTITWNIEFIMGELQQDGEIPATNGVSKMPIRNSTMLGLVPPWADRHVTEGVFPDPELPILDYVDWRDSQLYGEPKPPPDNGNLNANDPRSAPLGETLMSVSFLYQGYQGYASDTMYATQVDGLILTFSDTEVEWSWFMTEYGETFLPSFENLTLIINGEETSFDISEATAEMRLPEGDTTVLIYFSEPIEPQGTCKLTGTYQGVRFETQELNEISFD